MTIGIVALSGCATTTTTSSESQPASTEATPAETTSSESTPTESTPSARSETSARPATPSASPHEGKQERERHSEPEGKSGEREGPDSYSHAEDTKFCQEHECIGSFETESGSVVKCSDGTYSHAGGISGACSHHGGEG
jgi:hypothetical protein